MHTRTEQCIFNHLEQLQTFHSKVPYFHQSAWSLYLEQEKSSLHLELLCLWRHIHVRFLYL